LWEHVQTCEALFPPEAHERNPSLQEAGVSINRTEAKPKIAFDLGVVLGNERAHEGAPESEFKTKHVKDSKADETETAKSKAVKGCQEVQARTAPRRS